MCIRLCGYASRGPIESGADVQRRELMETNE